MLRRRVLGDLEQNGATVYMYLRTCVPRLFRSHYKLVHSSMHICMGKVLLWGIEFRVHGAGGVQGELVMLTVYIEL